VVLRVGRVAFTGYVGLPVGLPYVVPRLFGYVAFAFGLLRGSYTTFAGRCVRYLRSLVYGWFAPWLVPDLPRCGLRVVGWLLVALGCFTALRCTHTRYVLPFADRVTFTHRARWTAYVGFPLL